MPLAVTIIAELIAASQLYEGTRKRLTGNERQPVSLLLRYLCPSIICERLFVALEYQHIYHMIVVWPNVAPLSTGPLVPSLQ